MTALFAAGLGERKTIGWRSPEAAIELSSSAWALGVEADAVAGVSAASSISASGSSEMVLLGHDGPGAIRSRIIRLNPRCCAKSRRAHGRRNADEAVDVVGGSQGKRRRVGVVHAHARLHRRVKYISKYIYQIR